jgi:hypothetical protein
MRRASPLTYLLAFVLVACSGGATPAGGDACQGQTPADGPAVAQVTFYLTNTSGADRYVVTDGHLCDPYSISDVVVSGDYFQANECGEGVNPQKSATLTHLAPGAHTSLTWDGRTAVQAQTYTKSCGSTCQPWEVAAFLPVSSGTYTASFAVTSAVPARCNAAGDTVQCDDIGQGVFVMACDPGGGASPATVSQTFDLPASGSTTVPVSIP